MAERLVKIEEVKVQQKEYPVERVCSYCKKSMGLADFTEDKPGMMTHGLCSECRAVQLAKFETKEIKCVKNQKKIA